MPLCIFAGQNDIILGVFINQRSTIYIYIIYILYLYGNLAASYSQNWSILAVLLLFSMRLHGVIPHAFAIPLDHYHFSYIMPCILCHIILYIYTWLYKQDKINSAQSSLKKHVLHIYIHIYIYMLVMWDFLIGPQPRFELVNTCAVSRDVLRVRCGHRSSMVLSHPRWSRRLLPATCLPCMRSRRAAQTTPAVGSWGTSAFGLWQLS